MTSQLLKILITHVKRREIASFASLGPHKHAIVRAALKVSLALYGTIILPRRLVESNPHPDTYARDLWDQPNVRHCAAACIRLG